MIFLINTLKNVNYPLISNTGWMKHWTCMYQCVQTHDALHKATGFIPNTPHTYSPTHPLQVLPEVCEEFEASVEDVLLLLGQVVHLIPL